MLEDLSWCQIHLYTQHSNIADKNYEKNGANFRDLGFLTVDVTSSIYYMYDWVLMKKRLKNCKCCPVPTGQWVTIGKGKIVRLGRTAVRFP